MKTVNIQAAKTQLSRLVEEAVAGEEIIVAKAGKPMVRLVPFRKNAGRRRGGSWKGKVRISADFDATDPRLERLFEGEE